MNGLNAFLASKGTENKPSKLSSLYSLILLNQHTPMYIMISKIAKQSEKDHQTSNTGSTTNESAIVHTVVTTQVNS